MKKIKFKMPAFSLAEALITLLIVCLITLASIPVLTKKKRNVDNLASGKWICTLNSEGKYVYYNSLDPQGDINKPDTWSLSQNGEGCTFVSPQKAKSFDVTLIGGGGGGHDGSDGNNNREIKTYLDDKNKRFTVEEVHTDPLLTEGSKKYGVFYLAIVGPGGGGNGGYERGIDVGGQGGSGAYWVGKIKLAEDDNVSSHIGTPRQGLLHWQEIRDTEPSSLNLEFDKLILADNGGDGQPARDGASINSLGGNLFRTEKFNKMVVKELSASNGGSGFLPSNCDNITKYNYKPCADSKLEEPCYHTTTGCYVGGNPTYYAKKCTYIDDSVCVGVHQGITFLTKDNSYIAPLPDDLKNNPADPYYYGEGGFGSTYAKGNDGNRGLVYLWQVFVSPGQGGEAAKPEHYTLSNIKGKLEITIGNGGENNQNGRDTTVKYFRSGNDSVPVKTLYGLGGKAGNISSDKFSRETVAGEQGENSIWTNKGGGEAGKCVKSGEAVTQMTTKTSEEGKCLVGGYFLGNVYNNIDNDKTYDGINKSNLKIIKCPLKDKITDENPAGFCAACDVGKYGSDACDLSKGSSTIISYLNKIGSLQKDKDLSYYKNALSDFLVDSWIDYELPGYTYKEGSKPICFKNETKKITYKALETVKAAKFMCSDSMGGNLYKDDSGAYYFGNSFGAGGGGGSTSSELGAFGKGGYGAPGAVIIEW